MGCFECHGTRIEVLCVTKAVSAPDVQAAARAFFEGAGVWPEVIDGRPVRICGACGAVVFEDREHVYDVDAGCYFCLGCFAGTREGRS